MANFTLNALKADYTELWATMQVKENKLAHIEQIADKIIALKNRYEPISQVTNVPWYFIGLLHLRESNNNFNTHLHNGDPLSARTKHVPEGYPKAGNPPFTFEYSAIDALKYMKLDKVTDWSVAQIAYHFEEYNGFGYRKKRVNSPYLWSGTNHYIKGKYVKDGVYNASVVDQQTGVMPILKVLLDKINVEAAVEVKTVAEIVHPEPLSPAADIERPTNKELRKTSKKFSVMEWWQWLTGLGAGSAATVKTLDAANITATKTYVDTVKSFFGDYGVFIAIVILIVAFVSINYLIKRQKDDVEEGRYTPSGEANVS